MSGIFCGCCFGSRPRRSSTILLKIEFCAMAERAATRRGVDPGMCTSPLDGVVPPYPYAENEPLSPIEHRTTQWSDHAEDLRVDRAQQRSAGGGLSPHRCGECPYATKRRTNLERHRQAMHSRDKRLECCGSLFSSKSELRGHVRLRHRGGYDCAQCGRLFCRKALLKRHMSVHSGVKEFACRICSYASSHKSNLERHQRVHRKGQPPESKEAAILKARHLARDYAGDSVAIMAHLNSLYHSMADGVGATVATGTLQQAHAHTPPPRLSPKRMFANPYKCLLCNLRYQSQEALKDHERALHPDLEVQAFLSLPIKHVLHLMTGVRVAVAAQ